MCSNLALGMKAHWVTLGQTLPFSHDVKLGKLGWSVNSWSQLMDHHLVDLKKGRPCTFRKTLG